MVLAAAAGLGVALVPVASADPLQTVDYVSEEGAWPLEGSAHYAAPGDEIAVFESTSGRLWIDVSSGLKYLTVELSAPAGETLHTGTYTGAQFRGQSDEAQTTPGIFVYTMGNVCSEAYADFTIDRLDKDADGRTTDVDATFVQRCGAPDAPATRGEVHFHL
ncbi:hypothetical protein AMES_0827 [Amycolatopsis mediterranei S699]|uniref:Secreted protein n=2 Tax=Amycolatopsis mediterranei TaxID=33910 RepID=A0A0H3CXH7_AMYMU|nr:hypothetical protein [Amycolatopsis mediterranei]ADJ42649.1 conserved hypothetical protein [Amycolatopsis mediterranei U32]AEK39339.1 hypothetical protein RAM_04235 [Amycolatopsis mediterranei S699]AFO74363.1 hypothetical protein AMES_0827 [Amycolatopsis mediterranei S699]AGT81492.1 hypothetical protein B737_0828 [Amycolatopsis mediterranei RB]KDO10051.1 hypothetical protein DV26_15340 [Amycolatopsis mediterranei]